MKKAKKAKDRDFQGLWRACAMVALGFITFWPALHGGWFMNWDDGSLILKDARLRSLSGLGAIWIPSTGVDYWPLSTTFLWFEWHLFTNQPLGYHLFSLGLHILSGFLIWRLLARLGLRWGWLGGFLFIIHPLSVESVAWLSEIKNTFSLPFFLLSFISYLDFDEKGRESDYWKSLGFYLAAILAKTSVIMLPVVILLYCWWKRDQITLFDLKRTLPYFVIALTLGLVTVFLQNHHALSDAYAPRSPGTVFLCAGEAIFFYLGHFLCPFDLNLIYPRWTFDPPTLLQLLTWPVLCAVLGLFWLRRKGWGRHALFGAGFFLITVFPVLGFLNMTYMKISWVADHLVYLPIIGLIGLVVAGIECCYGKISTLGWPLGGAFLVAWLAWLSFLSYDHASAFVNEQTLWLATLKRNPDCWQAHNNLGLFLRNSGRMYEAIDEYQQALRIDPTSAETHNNLGAVYQFTNQPSAAIEQYEAAVRIKPDYPGMQFNLGQVLLLQGEIPEAIDHLEQAVRLAPDNANAQNNLGYALQSADRSSEAIPHFQQALRLQPNFVTAHLNLGNALIAVNRLSEAADEFETVMQIAPNTPGIQAMLEKVKGLEIAARKTH